MQGTFQLAESARASAGRRATRWLRIITIPSRLVSPTSTDQQDNAYLLNQFATALGVVGNHSFVSLRSGKQTAGIIMLNRKEKSAFHQNASSDGKTLTAAEREDYMKRFLPSTSTRSPLSSSSLTSKASKRRPQPGMPRKKPIRNLAKRQVYVFIYTLIHVFFGLYVRLRKSYHALLDRTLAILYYHHRTPEMIQRDVQNLTKRPQHLSVILSIDSDNDDKETVLENLLNEVGEVSAWCASAGIPELSIYERTGPSAPCFMTA